MTTTTESQITSGKAESIDTPEFREFFMSCGRTLIFSEEGFQEIIAHIEAWGAKNREEASLQAQDALGIVVRNLEAERDHFKAKAEETEARLAAALSGKLAQAARQSPDISDADALALWEVVKHEGNFQSMAFPTDAAIKAYARAILSPAQQEPAKALTLENAPIGTKAPAINGGHWERVEHGWKWCTGSTFPRPGGDWTGELIAPEAASATDAACSHVWNDYGQLGGRNVSWCPRCDTLAWTGKEPTATPAQATPEGGQDERAAFETWQRREQGWLYTEEAEPGTPQEDRWIAWQARAALAASQQATEPGKRPLFDRLLADLQQRGYEVIGRILHKGGEYALFDSSCRWLTQPQYWRLMHEQDGSLFAEKKAAEPVAWMYQPVTHPNNGWAVTLDPRFAKSFGTPLIPLYRAAPPQQVGEGEPSIVEALQRKSLAWKTLGLGGMVAGPYMVIQSPRGSWSATAYFDDERGCMALCRDVTKEQAIQSAEMHAAFYGEGQSALSAECPCGGTGTAFGKRCGCKVGVDHAGA
jgi:hypothetical protein